MYIAPLVGFTNVTVGGKFSVWATRIVTLAGCESASPSLALYAKVSVPLKLFPGTYWNEPSGLSVTAPWLGDVTRIALKGSPSGSVSLANTPGAGTIRVVFLVPVCVSGLAMGGRFELKMMRVMTLDLLLAGLGSGQA